jgi:hypothetical protein
VHADKALGELKRALNGYRHFRERIHIGATAWSERRRKRHQVNGGFRLARQSPFAVQGLPTQALSDAGVRTWADVEDVSSDP